MITKVRSTIGGTEDVERDLVWRDDEIHPYAYLDGYVIREHPTGPVFTQRLNAKATPVGKVLTHPNLVTALADLGWESI